MRYLETSSKYGPGYSVWFLATKEAGYGAVEGRPGGTTKEVGYGASDYKRVGHMVLWK